MQSGAQGVHVEETPTHTATHLPCRLGGGEAGTLQAPPLPQNTMGRAGAGRTKGP